MSAPAKFDKSDLQATLKRYMRFEERCAQAVKMKDRDLANAMRAGHNLAGWRIKDYLDTFPEETVEAAAEIGVDVAHA